jgi:hypothetical protein
VEDLDQGGWSRMTATSGRMLANLRRWLGLNVADNVPTLGGSQRCTTAGRSKSALSSSGLLQIHKNNETMILLYDIYAL